MKTYPNLTGRNMQFTFVCFVALPPKSTAMVMAGRPVHLTTLFPGQAWTRCTSCTYFRLKLTTTLLKWFSGRKENDRRNYFMINVHESMGLGWNRTRDPWICSQTCSYSQTRYSQSFFLNVLFYFSLWFFNLWWMIRTRLRISNNLDNVIHTCCFYYSIWQVTANAMTPCVCFIKSKRNFKFSLVPP